MNALATIAHDYSPAIAIALAIGYLRWASDRWAWPMVLDAGLLLVYCWRPSVATLAIMVFVVVTRHMPAWARQLDDLCDLRSYSGWTAHLIAFLLPAIVLSSPEEHPADHDRPMPVQAPIPGTSDTSAIPVTDRDIMKAGWVASMARSTDDRGRWIFSANQIYAAVGGHRADVLNQIRAIRDEAPAQFRQDDGVGPASYPVSKGEAL